MRPLFALRRGGRAATVGAVMETLPLNAFWLMTNRIGLQGSVWFDTGEGEDMAAMVAAGTPTSRRSSIAPSRCLR